MVLSICTLQLFHSALFHLMLNNHLNKTVWHSSNSVITSLYNCLAIFRVMEGVISIHFFRQGMETQDN